MSRSSVGTAIISDGGQPNYSPTTGLVYIFNLIVGTGALTLPAAFHDAGYVLNKYFVIIIVSRKG